MNSQQELLEAIQTISRDRDRSFDTPATVLRVEGDTVWVHIDGGAPETPALKTINCSEGETVQIRISNGNAFLVGNASAPPTDDKTANAAHFVAEQADIKAVKAEETATEVKETVEVLEVEVDGKVDVGTSNIQHLSSTMYQNANGVNIYNDTLAVGDSYAHIDGDSFDIKVCTTAGQIDDANDGIYASFGREVTVGRREAGSTVGAYSQVFGIGCVASGQYSHADGYITEASGDYSHAEGINNISSGYGSHAEGHDTEAEAEYSHAEGYGSKARGEYSHAEGETGVAIGRAAHAEGADTVASGRNAHSEGFTTEAGGDYSHAEGRGAKANGKGSHAQNQGTVADSDYQTVIGKYNIEDANDTYALIIGNGTGNLSNRSDALRVDWSGNVQMGGEVKGLNGNRKYIAEPSSEGTSGQVLKTDGAGGRTWGSVIQPTILTSSTISASTTSYTFTNSAITADSVIDIYDTIFGFSPTNMTVSAGSATVTFPAQSASHTIKLFVY